MDGSISSTTTRSSPLRFAQKPSSPRPLLNPTPRVTHAGAGLQRATRLRAISPSPSPSPPTPQQQQPMEAFGFDALKETFSVDVAAAEARPLNVPLAAPFTIASSRLEAVSNVAVRVELSSGAVGWGEAPVLPSVTAEDQPAALAAVGRACAALVAARSAPLGAVLQDVADALPGHAFASARAGVEMAVIDAVANSIRIPLWRLFGGASNTVTTDITIPIVTPNEAAQLAAKYRGQGFQTLKLKVGKNLNSDIEVLKAIRLVHPDCSFILDANEGYTANQAIEVLDRLNEMGVTPVLFEQPVHRDDWEGLREVSIAAMEKYRVAVAADESCRGLHDAQKIIHGNLAHVINIKLAKLGVLGALEVIDAARKAGVALMIGGMVETRIAMGFAGHLAAGLGCFSFIDLDTPLLLSEDPVYGGYEASGPVYKFKNARGHGGFLHLDNNNGWK
ncbi:L-Ala-D/L-amino acid epimerase [Aegilops tauschii subsp. strangulata]|uniref:Dipeptide epimerase n=1 Tax=Aegilops tauschii subsp. strangulata TaxID=200361 RepID=A0A453DV12_AEGTS|nr:L-Ala-D/L-amino acid epimerase [Aegilops tauschii subsp. strangulata]